MRAQLPPVWSSPLRPLEKMNNSRLLVQSECYHWGCTDTTPGLVGHCNSTINQRGYGSARGVCHGMHCRLYIQHTQTVSWQCCLNDVSEACVWSQGVFHKAEIAF